MKKKITTVMLTLLASLSIGFSAWDASPEFEMHPQFAETPAVTSTRYQINNSDGTISDVPFAESLETFIQNVSSSSGTVIKVTENDEITPATNLKTGYKLVLSYIEGGTIIKIYTIIVDDLPGDLFFSEYIEGNSNNKALEIFNPSDKPVRLRYFRIVQATNGGGWKNYHSFPTAKEIAPKTTWVIINSKTSTDLFESDKADEIENTAVVGYNGNDARGLVKIIGSDTSLIDVIGISDSDPGNGWDVAGIRNATMNKTLIRKPHIAKGNTDWFSSAGTNEEDSEWIVMPTDYFANLGLHLFEPGIISFLEQQNELNGLRVYPNPAGEILYTQNPYGMCEILIMDISGRIIIRRRTDESIIKFDISELNAGTYMMIAKYGDKQKALRFIKIASGR